MRGRLIKNCHIMIVASAWWDNDRQRFKVLRAPANHVSSICIDCGGFTAAKRWGKYPWTFQQYIDWIYEESRDVKLDFCAIMDYACEPGVNRSTYQTNIDRINQTIKNEASLIDLAPDLPWLPVLQGNTLKERAYDLNRRRELGQLPDSYAGIGSVCGRGAVGAIEAVRFYRRQLPGVEYHGFGMHIQALDRDDVYFSIKSWDSYSWNWGRGVKDKDRPPEYYRQPGETYTQHTFNLARLYWQNTIEPRLTRNRQLPMKGF